MIEAVVEQAHALVEVEQAVALGRVDQGGHHHLVEQACRGLDHLDMAVVDRIERSGI